MEIKEGSKVEPTIGNIQIKISNLNVKEYPIAHLYKKAILMTPPMILHSDKIHLFAQLAINSETVTYLDKIAISFMMIDHHKLVCSLKNTYQTKNYKEEK